MLELLTSALGVPRNVLADDEQIEHAWSQLPRLIKRIPPELRDERIVKMCVAVASGLFDAAINYVWNAAILELREKVRRFGIAVVPQVLDDKSFDQDALLDLKDAELLDLCLKLNLIGDDDYFFLDQCRATRNSFSAAHPAEGVVDEDEFLAFLSRCQKHALSSVRNPKGVDTRAMLAALKTARFKRDQREEWERRVRETYDAQRELIFVMLHGIYCDPDSVEEARLNALAICEALSDEFSPRTRSALVDRHQEYKAKGDETRKKASLQFFEKLGQLSLLTDAEVHSIFTDASRKLLAVHNGWDNFHNEPPFAERLARLSRNNRVPESAQTIFVNAVVTAGTGSVYGTSHAAMPHYREMVTSFSPNEVRLMLEIPGGSSLVANRIKSSKGCDSRFRALVALVDAKSVPTAAKSLYKKWLPTA
ncbi:hypothetical protein [Mesorhizobium sp. M7A.F.Ca.MR.176.00.0.0]|uniref:hypothetical protein n=1 Tax=Mesorhizobium sp. M7A.F.Ca.MR.176.00.0.0 TaxID=2496776 RepID=UPI0019D41846|nr:hypothetical protein [Mesorhizobium sp. M7A.F.Ca.MR.176.00.0.0]